MACLLPCRNIVREVPSRLFSILNFKYFINQTERFVLYKQPKETDEGKVLCLIVKARWSWWRKQWHLVIMLLFQYSSSVTSENSVWHIVFPPACFLTTKHLRFLNIARSVSRPLLEPLHFLVFHSIIFISSLPSLFNHLLFIFASISTKFMIFFEEAIEPSKAPLIQKLKFILN